jgi:D-alanine-D-alanine ligase-like ATP-grasp enzyme
VTDPIAGATMDTPAVLGTRLLASIAPRLGMTVALDPKGSGSGQLRAPDGRRFYFRGNSFDLNGALASDAVRDKARNAAHLRRMGYPVPDGRSFFSGARCRRTGATDDIAAGYRYARDVLGLPVIVKPNEGSLGRGVVAVADKRQYYRAMRVVFDDLREDAALVQRLMAGHDFRVVVLDGEVVAAYERRPLSVVGDGEHTILELVRTKLETLSRSGRPLTIAAHDPRIGSRLQRLHLTVDHVPPDGERVVVLDNANLSTGGDAVDRTDTIHPEFRALAVRLARDVGLRLSGLDLLAPSLHGPPDGYTVLEVNAAPLFDHFAALGDAQHRRVEAIYERILRALLER